LGKDGISNSLGLSKEEVVIPFEVVEQVGDRILVKKVEKDEINVDDYYGYLESKIKNIRL